MRNPARRALIAALMALAIAAPAATASSNGRLGPSEVAPIADGIECPDLGGQLRNDAAAAYNTLALAVGRFLPINGCDSAYRTYDRQVWWRNYWCAQGRCENAAYPGTSNHGWGLATDVPEGTYANYLRYPWAGFRKIEAFQEPWHWNFTGGFHRPDPGTNIDHPILRRGSGGPGQAPWVKKAQRRLRAHGYRDVRTDGDFGPTTRRAVTLFQKANGLPKTGVVRKGTWKALHTAPAVLERTERLRRAPAPPTISRRGVRFVSHWEGFYSCPYRDPVGVWTIGFGTTSADRPVGPTTSCISETTARRWMRRSLNQDYIPHIPRLRRLRTEEVAALGSFAYNLGPGAVNNPNLSTLARRLTSPEGKTYKGRKRIYRQEIPKWDKAGGVALLGLTKRRAAEVRLAIHADYSGRP